MNKNVFILLALLAILVLIAVVVLQQPGEQSLSPSEGDSLLAVDSALVDRILIRSEGSSLTLGKRGAEWFLEDPISYRADQGAVGTMLQRATRTMTKALISDKPEKHALFQVDSTGTEIVFFQKEAEQKSLVIGKQGPGYSEVYARRGNTNEVYLVDGALSMSARQSVKDWRDRTIVAMPSESIKEVRFQYGDTTFVLSWRDSLWVIGRDPADASTVNSFLQTVSNLQADDFLDTPPSKLVSVASVSFAGLVLRFSQSRGSDSYVVQSSLSPQLFNVPGWRAHQLLKRKKDFIKTTF